jgi:hypothetical protein
MSFLYRFALTITRQQPYLDWANSFDDGGPQLSEELARDRRTIYLVPESTTEPDRERLLDEFWEDIFEAELATWMDDETAWPVERTRELFDAWFESEATSAVYDLTPEEPLTQAEIDADDLAYAMSHCAWCELEVDEHAARFAAFKLPDRSRFAGRGGLPLSLGVDEQQMVTGIMTPENSEAALAGEDVVFLICSSRCEKAVRKAVPRAMRKLRS